MHLLLYTLFHFLKHLFDHMHTKIREKSQDSRVHTIKCVTRDVTRLDPTRVRYSLGLASKVNTCFDLVINVSLIINSVFDCVSINV